MDKLSQIMLDKIVARTVSKKDIHGSVFHIESNDKTVNLISAAGNINTDNQYYIASINKLIISFITLQLFQDKALDLDDKISQYLPENLINEILVYRGKDYSNNLTINHLISHTSGLPCYLIDKRPDGQKNMDLI